ncbi:FAD-binding protein [Lentibacter algarum]|uniref:FAD-binding protein n=1 Tax=Lentibacter algarum TaxID=576131 RepID=UPI001C06A963|nr:FAD-binding protein [Lentibacter algarum]MBU2981521.1 FAD-binding protein [Lentibacter algarum]
MFAPTSEAELSEVVAGLSAAVRVLGGGTRGFVRGGDDVLSVAKLSGVSLYEPGALTLVAAAGTPLSEVETMLAGEGQRLAFEPMDHRVLLGTAGEPTLGGAVSANVSGPRRVAVGACRDFALGVRFVDGTGRVLMNGGRVMKNVTGYDLVKLLSGSYGTLGVLSEVSLKVLPVPETELTLVLDGQDCSQAVAAMSEALGSPYEVTGAAHVSGKTYLRLEGFEAAVRERFGKLRSALKAHGEGGEIGAEASVKLWRDIRDVRGLSEHGFVAKTSLRPSAQPAMLAALNEAFEVQVQLDWGGGLAWVGADMDNANAQDLLMFLQDYSAKSGGHTTLIKGPDVGPVFQPETAGVARLSDAVRQKFDPLKRLNPNLMSASS